MGVLLLPLFKTAGREEDVEDDLLILLLAVGGATRPPKPPPPFVFFFAAAAADDDKTAREEEDCIGVDFGRSTLLPDTDSGDDDSITVCFARCPQQEDKE